MRFLNIRYLSLALALLTAGAAPVMAADTDAVTTRPAGPLLDPAPAAEPGPLPIGFGPQADPAAAPNDGKVHGMVSVGVGTSGYREAAVALAGPLPNGGSVSVSVDTAQIDPGRGRGRAPPPN